jgi:hypothetical protein
MLVHITMTMIKNISKMLLCTGQDIIRHFLDESNQVKLTYTQDKIDICIDKYLNFQGIYSFVLKKDEVIIVYVGKSEGDDRLRQHLTGKNKDGTELSSSVKTKYAEIRKAICEGADVHVSTYTNPDFTKATLSGLEITCIEIAKEKFNNKSNLKMWNERVG